MRIYIHSMYKKVLIGCCCCWLVLLLLLFCRRLFITALFFGRVFSPYFCARPKTNMKPVNKCNYLISSGVFFLLQYMFSLHAPFIAWIFSSSLSSVFVIWCNCTAWNAFNLFDLCALTCYIDVIAKSSNSSWNTRFVCVCVCFFTFNIRSITFHIYFCILFFSWKKIIFIFLVLWIDISRSLLECVFVYLFSASDW